MKVDKSKWKQIPLKDIADITMGQSPNSSSYNKNSIGLPFYQGNADFGRKNPIPRVYCNAPTRLAIANDILISVRAPIGAINLANEECCIGRGLASIRAKGGVSHTQFLIYALANARQSLNHKGTGMTFKAISKKVLFNEPISLPSIYEQEIIASELDALQDVIEGYREQIADLDALAQSIFLDTFGDPIANPKGWEVKPLKDLTSKMSTGPFGSMLHKEDYSDEGVPAINPQDIKNNQISKANIARVNDDKAKELKKYVLQENDVVIARRGDLSKCAIIRKEHEGWLCGTGSFFLTLSNFNSILFLYYYTSKSIQSYLNEKCIGATMPNLNQAILSSLKIPVPSTELQNQFYIQILAIEQQKDLIRQQLADAEMLMAERMQYYFS